MEVSDPLLALTPAAHHRPACSALLVLLGVSSGMNETREAVLAAVAEGPTTGPDLAATLDVSRAAGWKRPCTMTD